MILFVCKALFFCEKWGIEMKQKFKKVSTDIAIEILGSILIAVGIYNFAVTAKFPMTGISGIAIILFRLTGAPIGTTTLLLNIPIILLTFRRLGKGFFLRSLRCMVISSVFIDYLAPLFPVYQGDRLLAAISTGVLAGFGYAMIYLRHSSTGGTDFLTMYVKAIKPHLPLGKIILAFDATVVLAGGIIFKDIDGVIYGMMIAYLFSQVVDQLMYGINAGKMALIVTDHGQVVSDTIDQMSGRGSTILHGRGGYSETDKQVVMVACSNKEMFIIEKAVKMVDPKAFTIIVESNEVLGEGFHPLRLASGN